MSYPPHPGPMLYKATIQHGHLYIGEATITSETPTHLYVKWTTYDGPDDDTEFEYATYLTKGVHALYTNTKDAILGAIADSRSRIKNAELKKVELDDVIRQAHGIIAEAEMALEGME